MTEGPYKLPHGWRWVRLEEVAQQKSGVWGPEASDPIQGFPIVRSTEIRGLLIDPKGAALRIVPKEKAAAYKLQTGDILINKASGSPHLVGWPAIFEDPGDGRNYLFSNFMLRIRTNTEELDPWFLLYYLHTTVARSTYLDAQETTSGLRNLRIRDFMQQPIPLPPLEEQRRIVARIEELMGRIREARRLREEAKQEAERLWQAVLAETFPRPGSPLPPGWRWAQLGDVCEIWDSQRKPVKKKDRIAGDIPYCGANGVIDYVHGYTHEGEFVLLAEDGGFYSPGEPTAYLMHGRFWANNHVHVIRGKDGVLLNAFLKEWLVAADLRPYLTGTTRPKLTQMAMRTILIPLPPLEEQRRIVEHLESVQRRIRALKETQFQTEAVLKQVEQAILDRAFRGEL